MELDNKEQNAIDILRHYPYWQKKAAYLKREIEDLQIYLDENSVPGTSRLDTMGIHSQSQSSQEETQLLQDEKIIQKILAYRRELLEVNHKIKVVELAMEILSDDEKKIIQYRIIDRKTWQNTAIFTNASVSYCRQHAEKAINQLTKIFNNQWE